MHHPSVDGALVGVQTRPAALDGWSKLSIDRSRRAEGAFTFGILPWAHHVGHTAFGGTNLGLRLGFDLSGFHHGPRPAVHTAPMPADQLRHAQDLY